LHSTAVNGNLDLDSGQPKSSLGTNSDQGWCRFDYRSAFGETTPMTKIAMRTLIEVAKDLAAAHRQADPSTTTIKFFPANGTQEIRLLEVSSAASATARVVASGVASRHPRERPTAGVAGYDRVMRAARVHLLATTSLTGTYGSAQ
jgi:hypothetical protein